MYLEVKSIRSLNGGAVRSFSVLMCLLIVTLTSSAAFLRDVPVSVRQPDGSVLHCLASGDEFNNWLHDRNGYTIIQDRTTGWYLFAERMGEQLLPSAVRPGTADPAMAGLAPRAFITPKEALANRNRLTEYLPTTQALAPQTGPLNNIAIFIRFSDDLEFPEPQSVYASRFNAATPGANSLSNYFLEISYGRLEGLHLVPSGTHGDHGGVVSGSSTPCILRAVQRIKSDRVYIIEQLHARTGPPHARGPGGGFATAGHGRRRW